MATVYQLLAYPGTGKYTIAKEIVRLLSERGEHAVLLDNHATANLVWQMVPRRSRFEPEVMARVIELREVVLAAAHELAPKDASFVFTNFIPPDRPRSVIDAHRMLAVEHGRRMVALVLTCDAEEVLRRVTAPERHERLKLVDVERAREVMGLGMTVPDWPELDELDITGMSATEAAERIIECANLQA